MRWRVWLVAAALGATACGGHDSGAVDGGHDGAPGSYCAAHTSASTLICADFDGPSLDTGWTDSVLVGGGTLSLESTDVVSSPNALVAQVSASTTASDALLLFAPVGPATAFSGALRMNVKVPPCFGAGDVIAIASLQFFAGGDIQSGTISYQLNWEIGESGSMDLRVYDDADSGANGQPFDASQPLPLDAWTDIELDVDTAGSPHANVLVQGQVVLSTALSPGTATGAPRLLLGAEADKLAAPTCAIQFDDVELDRQ